MEQSSKTYPVEYPVGLTREEYIRSQQLLNRGVGSSRVISLVMAGLFVLMIVANIVVSKQVDWAFACLMAVAAAAEIALAVFSPRFWAERHGETYDQTLFSGYCFEGVVTVTETQVAKTTASGETVIPFGQCFYLEAEDMFIFRNRHGKSIVIPSRCLTEADAEATRAASLQAVPVNFRRLTARLKAQLTERLPRPALEKPATEEPLLTVKVEYTEKEFRSMMVDTAFEGIPKQLPAKLLLSVVISAVAYEFSAAAMVAVFLLAAMGLILFPVLTAGGKARRVLAATENAALTAVVELTPSHVRLRGTGEHGKTLEVPWNRVTRAVELPNRVELYTTKKLLILPKRCVEDMDELRRVVDEQMQ